MFHSETFSVQKDIENRDFQLQKIKQQILIRHIWLSYKTMYKREKMHKNL